MTSPTLRNQTAVATKWSTIAEVASRLVSPITNMILARILTPECFGVIATVTMVVSFADIFTDAGFQKFLIQHRFKDEDDLNKSTTVAFWTNLFVSLAVWVIIAVFNEQIATLVGNSGLGIVIVISALSLPLTSFSSIRMARYKRDFDFKTLFYVRLVGILLPFIVTVPLAFTTRSYWALVVGTLASGLANAILLTVKSKWKPSLYYNFGRLKQMFSYSWWILVEAILIWLTSYVGVFIVGMYLSTHHVGLYKTAMTTVNQIMGLITAATSAPLFSALSKLQDNHKAFNDMYIKYMSAVALFIIPMGTGILLFRDTITTILLGNQWTEIAGFVGLWGFCSSLCLVFGTYFSGYYNAKGKPKLSVLAQALQLVVLIPALILSSSDGFETLCLVRPLVRLEFIAVQFAIMSIVFKFPLFRLFKAVSPAILGTLVMGLVALGASFISKSLIFSIVAIGVCMLVYFLFMLVFFRKQLNNNLELLGFNFLRAIKNKFFGKRPGRG